MTAWTASRRETLKGLGVATAGVLGVSTAGAQSDEVTVTVQPSDPTVPANETVTVEVVVLGAENGIEGYQFDIVVDTSVATFVDFEENRGQFSRSTIADEGEVMRFEAALGNDTYEGATEVAIATVTLRGEAVGESALEIPEVLVQDVDSDQYDATGASGSVTVEPNEQPLSAAFDWEPAEPQVGEPVTFDAADSTGNVASYTWQFGDGNEATTDEATVTHAYEAAGEQSVTLVVEGPDGESDQTTAQVPVTESTGTVEAAFDWDPTDPEVGTVVTFDASESTGDVVEYRWDLTGDGSVDATTTDPSTVNLYEEAGEREVTLEVVGPEGGTDETSATVSVGESSATLTAAFDWEPAEPTAGETVTFDATDSTGVVAEYRWDVTGDGTVDQVTDGPTTTTTYGEPGVRTVTLEIADASGNVDTTSEDLTVDAASDPSEPTAAVTAEPTEPEVGAAVTFDASDTTGAVVEYRWDFTGDGSVDTTTDGPTVTHTYDTAGERTVELTVVDDAGETDSATVDVSAVESTPPLEASVQVAVAEPDAGDSVTFDASGSTGDIVEYRWDFTGDGSADATTTAPTASYAYDEAGTFTATLTVVDSAGQEATATSSLTVDDAGSTDDDSGGGPDDGTDDDSGGGPDDGTNDDSGGGPDDGTDDDSGGGPDDDSGGGSDDGTGNSTDDGGDDSSGDGFGPGFGPASALGGLGGAAYLLKRRLLDETEE